MKKELWQIIALFIIELMVLLPVSFALNIYDVQVTSVTSSSAKVSWKTDEYATGIVNYGKTTELGYRQRHTNYLFEHSLYLYGLEGETKYYVSIESTDLNGTTKVDNNSNNFYTFTTLDITPPGQVNGLMAESIGVNSVYIRWNNINATDFAYYNIYRDRVKVANTTQTRFNDTGLLSDRSYSYKVSAVDTSNNEGSLSDTYIATTLKADTTLPLIANVDIEKITDNSATIKWLTDENATSVVYYGINQSLDKIKDDSNFITNHTVTITGLLKGNKYSYKASSCDRNNNCANSSVNDFEAGADLTPPLINATIPEFYNKKRIDIIGSVEPYSKVRLFVNDMLLAARALDREETAEGSFEFYNVVLSQNNMIKVWAQDKAGNVNEQAYNLIVDTEEPVVDLKEMPSIINVKNITIEGSVNEFVTMNVYLRSGEDIEPEKITGLEAKAENNSVELSWDKSAEKDFSHYVVYRSDVGAIAITQPESYNSYKDVLVNDAQSYTYQVSAVNQFGNQGPKSDPVTVLISGGKTGLPKPEEIADVIRGVKKPTLSVNLSGSFNKSINLKNDGFYALKIEFIDKALNTVLVEKEIILDTKPPNIEIIRPRKGTLIYENYANEVEIEGQTEPFSDVHLFIERTPLGFLNKSFDVSGLPNEIQHIPESELKADCRLVIGGTSFCSTGADYSTKADSEGYFTFEKVDLTSWFSLGTRIGEVPATEFTRERELEESREARLVFIATDQAGLRNAVPIKYNIGTCWSGNFSWELTPVIESQSPSVLSMERLREGNEEIYFFFNYNYVGRGENAVIKQSGISVEKACSGTDLLRDSRFNLSCKVLPQSEQTRANPEGTISYTAVKLNRLPNMEKWLQDDWKGFFKALGNEMTFPFKVRITYEHEVDGKKITETQTTCQEVTYVLDNSLIDFRDALPDWVLYDVVDFLNSSVNTINKVQKELRKIMDYVAVGCVSSFLLRFVVQVYRRWVSIFDEKMFMLNVLSFNLQNEEDKNYCQGVVEGIKEAYKLGGFGGVKLKYFSDADLKKCFPRTASAWEAEAKLYNIYRFSCDRLFGHASPSKWTEQATDDKLYTKLQEGKGCAVDQSVMGKPLSAVKCRDVAKDFLLDKEIFSLDDKCFVVKEAKKGALYTLGQIENREYNLYYINKKTGDAEIASDYAIKQTERNYLTAQDRYCAEVCGITEIGEEELPAPPTEKMWKGAETEVKSKEQPESRWACMSAQECITLGSKPPAEGNPKVTSSYSRGFTKDCFYNSEVGGIPKELRSPESVSNDPNRRFECCCINAVKYEDEGYYRYDDEVRYTVKDEQGPEYAFESKKEKGKEPQGGTEVEKWADMKWSYRYWKEKFETVSNGISHYQYNPNRYIQGRDFPACFGQNHWLYDGLGKSEAGDGNLLIMDPAKQHISAFQCLHIAGINNRLQILKNMMSALSACLITVRTSGRGDTGVCKELFSQYACSLFWYVIQFWQEGCLPFGEGIDLTKSENKAVQYLSMGLKGIGESVTDTQKEVAEEYGNAKLNDLLGTGEEAIARKICLAAFGYDWELNLDNVVDAAYASPSATLVHKITGSREYLTVDPETNKAKYEYRASWLINPGCDMRNYKVELSCVSRNEMDKYGTIAGGFGSDGINCEKVKDPEGQNCDCLELDKEKTEQFYSHTGKLTQGTLEDRDWHRIISSNYRYDHLKFTLYPDRRITKELRERCFPDMHEDGVFYFPIRDKTIVDLEDCHLDPSQGQFVCTPGTQFWTKKGRAQFVGVKINWENPEEKDIVVYRGGRLVVEPTIRKLPGPPVCLRIELDKYGIKEPPRHDPIDADGEHNYIYNLETNIQPSRTGGVSAELSSCELKEEEKNEEKNKDKSCREVIGSKLLRLRIISASNIVEETISIMFEDKWSTRENGEPDDEINLRSDSEDVMIVNNDLNKKISEWWDKEYGAPVINLEDLGIKLKIDSVGFDKRLKVAEYNKVEIPALKDGIEQRWRLSLSLYETRDNSTDCSMIGDVISYQGVGQTRKYEIKLMEKSKGFGPKISIDAKDDVLLTKDLPLKVKVLITDETGINEEVKYESKTPENKRVKKVLEKDKCFDTSTIDSKRKECDIWLEEGDLTIAGAYSITVTAVDTDKKPNKAEETARFNVRCYDDRDYGDCQNVGSCTNEEIESPILGCFKDYKCCKIGPLETDET